MNGVGSSGGPTAPVSLDAVLYGLLVAAYLPTRFIVVLPPIVPGDTGATTALVLAAGCYFALDMIRAHSRMAARLVALGKWLLIAVTIGLLVIAPLIMIILVRHQTADYLHAHDGLIQTEAAVRFVLAGKNPYVENYYNTPMAQAPFKLGGLSVNPALEHYAYLPLTFLLPLPLQALMETRLGWFDQRFIHLVFYIVLLMAAASLSTDRTRQRLLVMALGLNPLFAGYFIEGRNDVLVLTWVVVTVALAQRGRMNWAALTLGLACATKHPAWLMVPLFFLAVSGTGTIMQRLRNIWQPALIFAATAGVFILPYFLANTTAFLDDTVYYLAGTTANSYPISGIGFGAALVAFGIIQSNMTPFPFGLFQAAFGLPVLAASLWRQWQRPSLATALAASAVLLFILQFFSRLFNDNYLGVIIELVIVAALMDGRSASAVGFSAPDRSHTRAARFQG
jgi:hypothetical protein